MATENLGLVKAIYVQTVPPTNIEVIWLDTSLPTPLHKAYNPTSTQWEAFIYLTLIDNNTIKKNGSNQLYVDEAALAAYVLQDGSVTLVKMADVASGSVFYRKTAGSGRPEVQTLGTLKTDLGLTGTNSGDQDLSTYVLKLTTINGKALTGNITLTPTDIGSPAGSGTSSGVNTGNETEGSILTKLGISSISGVNTGDQIAGSVPIADIGDLFTAENVEDALQEVKQQADGTRPIPIILPAADSVANRIAGAVEGTDYPEGWVLTPDGKNLDIEHNLGRNIANVTVFNFTNATDSQLRLGTTAYTMIYDYGGNTIKIQSLATINSKIRINLMFV